MTLESERVEILKMVEAKQISPEEGARLLGALASERRVVEPIRSRAEGSAANGRWLRIHVQEPGRQSVNLTLPLAAIPAVLRVARRWVPEEHRDALDVVATAMSGDFRGELLRVEEPGRQTVHIWIE